MAEECCGSCLIICCLDPLCNAVFDSKNDEEIKVKKAWENRRPLLCNLSREEFTSLFNQEQARLSAETSTESASREAAGLPKYFYVEDPYVDSKTGCCNPENQRRLSNGFVTLLSILSIYVYLTLTFNKIGTISTTDQEYYTPYNSNLTIHIQSTLSFWNFHSTATGPNIHDISSNVSIRYFDYSNTLGSDCQFTTYRNLIVDNITADGNTVPYAQSISNTLPLCPLFQIARILSVLCIPISFIYFITDIVIRFKLELISHGEYKLRKDILNPPSTLQQLVPPNYQIPSEEDQYVFYHQQQEDHRKITNQFIPVAWVCIVLVVLVFSIMGICFFVMLQATEYDWDIVPVCMMIALIWLPMQIIYTVFSVRKYRSHCQNRSGYDMVMSFQRDSE